MRRVAVAALVALAAALGWRWMSRAAGRVVDDDYDLRLLPHADPYVIDVINLGHDITPADFERFRARWTPA